MNIRQILLPLAIMRCGVIEGYSKFDEFTDQLEPHFNGGTECSDLSDPDSAAIILQFSIISGISLAEVTSEFVKMRGL